MQDFTNINGDREFKVSVLVVDDEETSRKSAMLLCRDNFRDYSSVDLNINEASSIDEALERLSEASFHLILLDRDLGCDREGKPVDAINFISEMHMIQPFAEIIMLTANEQALEVVRAMQKGASNYLLKNNSPESSAHKATVIRNAFLNAKTKLQQARLSKEDRYLDTDYICMSPAMQQLNMKLEALAESNRPVLIGGPSGLGKGATARVINKYRAKFLKVDTRPFFNLNIAAMGDEFAQSELFGHEAFSFTGAGNRPKPGYFELANGGDLFLDEIGDASIELQTKLLKVIEEREFQRIGGSKTLKTTARVIFATNKDLKQLVAEGKFKPDLYARISTFEIQLPSLVPLFCYSDF
jgi:DNA-binding NtrC family response regulator